MSWLKIDDGLFLHPKWVRTSATARALWITALSYCGKMMTDGRVDSALLPLLGGSVEDASELVASGLWDESEGGYAFHDFEEYNRTTEQASALSEVRQAAGKAGATSRWSKQNDSKPIAKNSNCMANEWQKMPPVPEPEPVPVPDVTNVTSSSPQTPQATQGLSVPVTKDDDDENVPAQAFGPKDPLPAKALEILRSYPEWWQGHLRLALTGRAPRNLENYAMKVVREWAEGKNTPQAPLTAGVSHLPRLTPGVRASLDREINSHQFMNDLEATLREEGLV